jgi:hypothetical protein
MKEVRALYEWEPFTDPVMHVAATTAKDTAVGLPAIARRSERVARPPGVDGEF